jgi:hypothetical protein
MDDQRVYQPADATSACRSVDLHEKLDREGLFLRCRKVY